ncbi:CYFA0S07e00760g1_1 [Cyberlindnera fabianii]|uniref:CYFA0S07e00760g1_1 n=1 Tax=Cyberlindnera fabianii TaxID=36022 RepID=A0A061B106_CYBFA|nr:NADH dehydrogenase [ubiquinone] 1 alpha subcomplex subunit 5 [Cyberlindnera fabianii]CDR41328.1 CYFA0S07e00760g1_1 [Cyberlindnera fabianii]
MRFTRALRSAHVLIRASEGNPTGIAGILQHPNPRPVLMEVYRATLEFLHDELPNESVYKKSTMNFTAKRLEIVEKNEKIADIENKIGNGLIEELLIQAGEEYELAKKMKLWESWDELEEKPLDDQWVYFGKKI